jgi:5-methyltetrahydrofolate--homocysteine methyltransferase
MGIVNAGQLAVYDDIPADLKLAVEDVILNRSSEGTEALMDCRPKIQRQCASVSSEDTAWRDAPVEKRLAYALVKGNHSVYRRRHRSGAPILLSARFMSSKAPSWTA